MRIFSTQVPYDATQGAVQDTYLMLQHAPDYSHALPRNTIAFFDNSVNDCTLHSSNSTVLKVSGSTDLRCAVERKQWDGFIDRWSHVVFYGGSHSPAGELTRDTFSMSSSLCEHYSYSHLYPHLQR